MNISELVPLENVAQKIFVIRGLKVMLDSDLAVLYQVPTKRLNEQVKRNPKRFPPDFMFQLTRDEIENLRSQIATSTDTHGGARYMPQVFTEHGVAMLSTVLKSPRATQMSVFIVRAFIKMRELLASNKELAYRIESLEKEQSKHGENIEEINEQLKRLTSKPPKPSGPIGFRKS